MSSPDKSIAVGDRVVMRDVIPSQPRATGTVVAVTDWIAVRPDNPTGETLKCTPWLCSPAEVVSLTGTDVSG